MFVVLQFSVAAVTLQIHAMLTLIYVVCKHMTCMYPSAEDDGHLAIPCCGYVCHGTHKFFCLQRSVFQLPPAAIALAVTFLMAVKA